MIKKHLVFLVLFIIFLLSVLIRFNQISPIVKSHEQTYILTLQTSEIWRTDGLFNCHLTPMWTYNNPGDKYIAYYKRLEDNKGNNYYVSFPPLSFIVAHIVLSPFNLNNGKLVLQIFNLLLHFFSAIIIYLIICLLYNHTIKKLFAPALVAFVVYLFMPVMLYFHTDIFFPEMLGQVLWIVSIYVLLLYKRGVLNKPNLTLFITLFIFLYSEWIAVFFIITIFLYCILSKNKENLKKLLFVSSIALIFAGFLMFIQYASITGVKDLLHSMGIRFLERSGFFGQKYSSMGIHIFSLHSLKLFALNLNKALSIFGYITIILFLILIFRKKISISSDIKLLLFLIIIPLLIHWIIFFNANAIHLLLMARTTVPISIIAGIASCSIINKHKASKTKWIFTNSILTAFILFSAIMYKRDFTFSEQYTSLYNWACSIKDKAKHNQSIFITSDSNIPEPEKYLTFISKRNIVRVADKREAEDYMNKINKNGEIILFHLNNNACSIEIIQHYR